MSDKTNDEREISSTEAGVVGELILNVEKLAMKASIQVFIFAAKVDPSDERLVSGIVCTNMSSQASHEMGLRISQMNGFKDRNTY